MKRLVVTGISLCLTIFACSTTSYAKEYKYKFLEDLSRQQTEIKNENIKAVEAITSTQSIVIDDVKCLGDLSNIVWEMEDKFNELSDLSMVYSFMGNIQDKKIVEHMIAVRASAISDSLRVFYSIGIKNVMQQSPESAITQMHGQKALNFIDISTKELVRLKN